MSTYQATFRHIPAVLLACLSVALSMPLASADELSALPVTSFEGPSPPAILKPEAAEVSLVSGKGVTDGGQALHIELASDSSFSGIKLSPEKPWECGSLGDYRLSFDASNLGSSSVHLRCTVANAYGATVRRTLALPANSSQTVYFPLVGDNATKDNGLRDDPPALEGVGRKMLIGGLKQKANFSRVKSVNIYVEDAAQEDILVIDNLRFATNPSPKPGYLERLVDRFGQSANTEFEQKVHSDDQLKQLAEEELARLKSSSPMQDRSKFGGWKTGPRLKATGYFRTEKVGNRWTLVDPEGYLYFATGIDNLRMANTSTFTGVDFKDDTVRYRDPKDLTPEDSIGITPSKAEIRATRYVAQPWRHKMFDWLPDYDHPLAKHYGYRRSSHLGPIEHGEVFSFYRANLERRYGNPSPGHAMQVWRGTTMNRMLDWGFTSLGNWTDAAYYDNQKIPFFANGWIIGEFKTVSTGYDYWGPMPDPFDPAFAERAKITTEQIAREVKGTPWCVGVFIDNEKSWGNLKSTKTRYGLVINSLSRDAAESPTKAKFVEILRDKYSEIENLNEAWGIEIGSWQDLAKGIEKPKAFTDPEMLADFSILSETYANEYFRIVHDALEAVLPNQMYLGCRMTPWGMTPESRRAAAKYADVMSYNYYRESLGTRNWGFLEEVDMPSIIGEWHMGATDNGSPHAGIIHAANQEDRGRMYEVYMNSVIDNPYFVGAHWFQYIDSPITGRAHDGENYNVGFVTVADIPYKPMVDAAKNINRSLYQRSYGPATENQP